jgi:hypothetical protein
MDGVLVGGDSGLELLDLGAQEKNLEIDGGVDCAMKQQLVSSQEQNKAAMDGKGKAKRSRRRGPLCRRRWTRQASDKRWMGDDEGLTKERQGILVDLHILMRRCGSDHFLSWYFARGTRGRTRYGNTAV